MDDYPLFRPQLASFIKDDDNKNLTARKYSTLRAKMLLYRQDELFVLEEILDQDDHHDERYALQSRELKDQSYQDKAHSRKALMERIDQKLKQYGKDSILYLLAAETPFVYSLTQSSLQMTW